MNTTLERRITGWQATLLVVGSMVGSGILATPAIVASAIDSKVIILLLWGGGAFYALTGALSQAKLAALYPRAGGDYVFLRHSYGKLIAFLSGWVSLTVGFAGSLAGIARSCGQYLMRGGISLDYPGFPMEEFLAVAIIIVLTAINLMGVSKGSIAQAVLTVGKVAGLLILAGAALAVTGEPPEMSTPTLPIWAAILPVVFAYTGWNDSIYLGSEIRNPQRNLPLSLIGGTLAVALVYLAFNYAYVQVTGGTSSGEDLAAAAAMAECAFGTGTSVLVAWMASLVLLGTLAAMVVTGPRIAYAMGLDSALPKMLSTTNRKGVPANALLLQAAIALIFVRLGSIEEIFSWVGFALALFSGLATSCVFLERRRHRKTAYEIPLYPLPPLLYIAASVSIAVYVGLSDPICTGKGLLFIVAGLPVYWFSNRRRRA